MGNYVAFSEVKKPKARKVTHFNSTASCPIEMDRNIIDWYRKTRRCFGKPIIIDQEYQNELDAKASMYNPIKDTQYQIGYFEGNNFGDMKYWKILGYRYTSRDANDFHLDCQIRTETKVIIHCIEPLN